MMKKIKFEILLLTIAAILMIACGGEKKKEISPTLDNQTPVASKDLRDLAPDTTFDEVRPLVEIINDNAEFNTLNKLLRASGVYEKVETADDITIFAPINNAFSRLTDAKLAHLKTPQGMEETINILQYHIVKDEFDHATLESAIEANRNALRLKTLNGGYISLSLIDGEMYITDENALQSKIVMPDEEASNGVLHGIDGILLPQQQQ
ncbi:fasciclin domain-containing protein [Sungkyunkwania multivorans]|uniref:Fasciclin domain-containing protein n=1 Tax=Sungkyunkwania multivorans TaxID=1173618 RepID=A0ABW3CTN0_9FLAO